MKLVLVPDIGINQNQVIDASTLNQLNNQAFQSYQALLTQANRLSTGCELINSQLIRCLPSGVIQGTDYQMMGKVSHVHTPQLQQLLEKKWIVWQPPIGYSASGQPYACNTNSCAAKIAQAALCDKVIYLSQQPLISSTEFAPENSLSLAQFKEKLKTSLAGHTRAQQLPQMFTTKVKRVHLLDSQQDGCLIEELLSTDGSGLLIHNDGYDKIEQANESHIQGILELIKPHLDSAIRPRTKEDLDKSINNYSVIMRDTKVIGCVALQPLQREPQHPQASELSCLVIHQGYQNKNFAKLLLEQAIKQAKSQQDKQIFALTISAESWFTRNGFHKVDLKRFPANQLDSFCRTRNSHVLCLNL